jgi:hypothetical protein
MSNIKMYFSEKYEKMDKRIRELKFEQKEIIQKQMESDLRHYYNNPKLIEI